MARDVDGIIQQKFAESGDVGLDGLTLAELWTLTYSTPGGLFPSRLQFNQLFRYLSAFSVEINQKGPFLEYAASIDYSIGAIVRGSDGILYIALAVNGPGSSVVDPVGDITYKWIIDITKLTQFDCNISDAVAALGTIADVSILNDCKSKALTGNLSIPKNINLNNLAGKEFNGPHTLTLDRPEQIQAGDYPVISSGLTLNITKAGIINPKHYGIIPELESAAVSNTTIINDLLANLPPGCQFDFKPLDYWWADGLETTKAFGFMGSGSDPNNQWGAGGWTIFRWAPGSLDDKPGLKIVGDNAIANILNMEFDMREQTGTDLLLASGISVDATNFYSERVIVRKAVGHNFFHAGGNNFRAFRCMAISGRVDIRDAFDPSSTPSVPVYDPAWDPESLHGDGFYIGSDSWVSHCKASFCRFGINAFTGHPQIIANRCDLNTHDGIFKGSVAGDATIVGNISEKNGRAGIRLASTGNTVQGNILYDNGQYGGPTNAYELKERSGIYVTQDQDLLTGPRNLIDGNTSNNLNVPDSNLDNATQFGLYVENDTRVKLGVNSFVNAAIAAIRLEANVSTSDDNYTVLSNNLVALNFSFASVGAGINNILSFATYLGNGSRKYTMPYRGFIAAISVNTETPVTAGDITVKARIDGGVLQTGPVLDTTNALANTRRFSESGLSTIFAPNSTLDCQVSADAGLLPDAAIDLNITVFVGFE